MKKKITRTKFDDNLRNLVKVLKILHREVLPDATLTELVKLIYKHLE